MDSAEKIRILKQIFEAKTDEELAEKLEVSVFAVRNWKQRDNLPKKYELLLVQKVGDSFSNNANSVIVNGNNSGSIINGHQVNVSDEFMEVAELFKKYGIGELLKKWKEDLLKIKDFMGK